MSSNPPHVRRLALLAYQLLWPDAYPPEAGDARWDAVHEHVERHYAELGNGDRRGLQTVSKNTDNPAASNPPRLRLAVLRALAGRLGLAVPRDTDETTLAAAIRDAIDRDLAQDRKDDAMPESKLADIIIDMRNLPDTFDPDAYLAGIEKLFNARDIPLTTPTAKAPWLFDILITMAGYLGPSMFGLFGAWLLVRGQTVMVLWASMAFLVLMLFAVRGILGWLTVPGLLVLLYLVTMRVDPPLQTLYTHMWVWFLLIGAVQRMLHFVLDRQYESGSNDSAVLAGLTLVPSAIWAFVFLVGTIGALVYGGAMLLRI